jgi:hypothetical protein
MERTHYGYGTLAGRTHTRCGEPNPTVRVLHGAYPHIRCGKPHPTVLGITWGETEPSLVDVELDLYGIPGQPDHNILAEGRRQRPPQRRDGKLPAAGVAHQARHELVMFHQRQVDVSANGRIVRDRIDPDLVIVIHAEFQQTGIEIAVERQVDGALEKIVRV